MHHWREAALWRRLGIATLALMLAVSLVACNGGQPTEEGDGGEATEQSTVVLASTTSTEDSGLFEELVPAFEEAYPQYNLQVVAVGTGQALEQGRNKDADVLLVHAKEQEEEFVAEGYGTERTDVMYNDFVIVGPPSDPAGIKGMDDAAEAFKKIADTDSPFISRGDDSGTHSKELSIWKAASVEPTATGNDWYQEVGQGMGETLRVASEQEGYTLADRATWLATAESLELELLVEGDERLFNQYGVIPVTDANNQEGGQAFAEWIVSDEAQELIGAFGTEQYGEPLFVPNAP
jgi:tungstate transport system substrate-binding protein